MSWTATDGEDRRHASVAHNVPSDGDEGDDEVHPAASCRDVVAVSRSTTLMLDHRSDEDVRVGDAVTESTYLAAQRLLNDGVRDDDDGSLLVG